MRHLEIGVFEESAWPRSNSPNPPSRQRKPRRSPSSCSHRGIQFPAGIAQGELPPLFVVGPDGKGELVNYRFHAPYEFVDRLFGAAELRLGGKKAAVVRIGRTDGIDAGAGHGHD